jgi:hypothetical protein
LANPENVSANIQTNLSPKKLKEFIEAIDSGVAKEVPGTASVFAESGGCEFVYNGETYIINESYEVLDVVLLVPKGKNSSQFMAEYLSGLIIQAAD